MLSPFSTFSVLFFTARPWNYWCYFGDDCDESDDDDDDDDDDESGSGNSGGGGGG